jgi:hypothetical protein
MCLWLGTNNLAIDRLVRWLSLSAIYLRDQVRLGNLLLRVAYVHLHDIWHLYLRRMPSTHEHVGTYRDHQQHKRRYQRYYDGRSMPGRSRLLAVGQDL